VIIGISGNIGAGKSSLVAILHEELNYDVVYEIVDENPYLKDFYKDMKKWAFHSELYFLIKRFDFLKNVPDSNRVILQDRTIYEDVYIFTRNLYLMGYIDSRDWHTYMELFKTFCDHLPVPSGLIYIKASVQTLEKRIKKRGREFEIEKVDSEYLSQLEKLYDDWFNSWDLSPKLIIDGDKYDFIESVEDKNEVIKMIKKFINTITK
jgi:deoxyadenosine/deoxycytidine kinase